MLGSSVLANNFEDTPKTPLKFKRHEFAVLGGTHHLTISSFNAKFPAGLGLHRAGMSMEFNGCQSENQALSDPVKTQKPGPKCAMPALQPAIVQKGLKLDLLPDFEISYIPEKEMHDRTEIQKSAVH